MSTATALPIDYNHAISKQSQALPITKINANTHTLRGRLIHANGDPCRNQKVTVFVKGWFFNTKIGEFKTDVEGAFKYHYNWKHSFLFRHRLILGIYETAMIKKYGVDAAMPDRIIYSTLIDKPLINKEINAGTVTADFFEYADDFPTLKQSKNMLQAPEEGSLQYFLDLLKAIIKPQLKHQIYRLTKGLFNTAAVQDYYGAAYPDMKVSPQTTLDMILNGIYPWHFQKGKADNELIFDINWDRYRRRPTPDLPNATLTVMRASGGKLTIKEVAVQCSQDPALVCTPEHPEFSRALYLFNSAAIVRGEIVTHLGMGHLATGQASMAVFRHLRDNPLARLLCPHLYGVHRIDHLGATAIFGRQGALAICGLQFESIAQTLKDVLSGICYSTFKPRQPLNDDHRFAKAEQLYWTIVSDSVDQFFTENHQGIVDNWPEIYSMSKSLVEHSLPYYPWDGISEHARWYDPSEIDDPTVPRQTLAGETKAIRPITLSKMTPSEGDIERLKQFCRHSIFMATFWHWAVHTSQEKWVANLHIASLAPRNGAKEPLGGTYPDDGSFQLATVQSLINFDSEDFLDNPHGNIYPVLIAKLKAKKKAFAALGYKVEDLHFGTII